MPPAGGVRTSLKFQTQLVSGSFGQGNIFSPGTPLQPPQQQPTRFYDYAVGENLVYTPRAGEPFSFAQLRAFSNVELVRFAIETRKDQIGRLRWRVRSRDERKPKRGFKTRIAAAEALLRKPDGVNPFRTWMRSLLEELLVLDAPALERRRTFGGQIVGLDIVPGDTIKVLVDVSGRRPAPPADAFQQVIKGRLWANLRADELIYVPRNVRANHAYGFGPVEQCVVTINTILQRQARQLGWFTEGNMPPGLITAPEGWSPDQIKAFQEWFDEKTAPGTAGRSRLIWGPANAKYSPFKDPPLKDEFDEWLARVVCYCFSLPPTPFIKQMNRATADNDAERALEEGREPLMLWAKDWLDDVIQNDLGFDDLEFDWDVPKDIDPKVQSEIENSALRNGSMTIDEVRDVRGQDPLPNGIGAKPMIYTAKGAMLVEHVVNAPPPDQGQGDAEDQGDGQGDGDDGTPKPDEGDDEA